MTQAASGKGNCRNFSQPVVAPDQVLTIAQSACICRIGIGKAVSTDQHLCARIGAPGLLLVQCAVIITGYAGNIIFISGMRCRSPYGSTSCVLIIFSTTCIGSTIFYSQIGFQLIHLSSSKSVFKNQYFIQLTTE
ncbi:hypothetical protein D9M68_852300 [compost metagenome]